VVGPGESSGELALCLSGGGYRAMLFHLGALWRLNEAGLLSRLDRISSVSGGSIAAGMLARRWPELAFDGNGVAAGFGEFASDVHAIAGRTIDARAILRGSLGPGAVGDAVGRAYRRRIFGDATLADLPDHPRFVFCATNLQTGSLWRFSKPYMADYRIGTISAPATPLATVVAASSAFPPFLSPVVLDLPAGAFDQERRGPLHQEPYTTRVVLSDGGVYDNLGLQPVLGKPRTVLVSDGGGRAKPEPRPRRNWPLQLLRVLKVVDQQVRALRSSQLVAEFQRPGGMTGAYWGIRTPFDEYEARSDLAAPLDRTAELAATPTRLAKLDRTHQRRLVNWGYAVSDAALRTHAVPELAAPAGFPYEQEVV
jgi:NTE family protein